jgi:hypothetical protein
MTTTSNIPAAVLDLLSRAEGLPVGISFIERHEKTIENDIEAELAKLGVCMFVMPVKLLEVQEGADFIFVRRAEVRVRLVVDPMLNETGMDSPEIAAQARLALQGTNPGDLLDDAMRLANPPVEEVEDPSAVVLDLLFRASYQESK